MVKWMADIMPMGKPLVRQMIKRHKIMAGHNGTIQRAGCNGESSRGFSAGQRIYRRVNALVTNTGIIAAARRIGCGTAPIIGLLIAR
jgi:hypothetical protein